MLISKLMTSITSLENGSAQSGRQRTIAAASHRESVESQQTRLAVVAASVAAAIRAIAGRRDARGRMPIAETRLTLASRVEVVSLDCACLRQRRLSAALGASAGRRRIRASPRPILRAAAA